MCEDGKIPLSLQMACSLCRHRRETSSVTGMIPRACRVFFVSWREGGRRENAHPVEEIDETCQLRSLETQQIAIFFIALDQAIETAGKFRRKSVERVEEFQDLRSGHREWIYLQDSAGKHKTRRGEDGGTGDLVAAMLIP